MKPIQILASTGMLVLALICIPAVSAGDSETSPNEDKTSDDAVVDAYEGTKTITEGTDTVEEGTKIITEGTDTVSEGTNFVSEGTNAVREGTNTITEGTTILSSKFSGTVTGYDRDKNIVTVVGRPGEPPQQYNLTQSTEYIDQSGSPVTAADLKRELPVLIEFNGSEDGSTAVKVTINPKLE